jgi:hypothetical protein
MSFSTPLAWYWVLAPLLVAALAGVLLLRALVHLAHGRLGHGGLHATGGLMLGLAALCAGLVVLNTQSFARLTKEREVAEVTVAGFDPSIDLYSVTVQRLDGTNQRIVCSLQGDEWIMSARVQKWRPWANILGLDSTYSLDQIANKYLSAARGNGKKITACDLSGPPDPAFLSGVSASLAAHSYAEERRFGSAVYMPLADGAIYRVLMTQTGLNAEPANPIAWSATNRDL